MAWSFRKMSRGEMNADPIEGEFFTPEGMADALVRESIQNSLDARANGQSVKVRFYFSSKSDQLSPDKAATYLEGLWPHLQSIENGRVNLPSPKEPMTFLVIEDFGTRGLCGSIDQDHDEAPGGQPKDFYYFWRNIGRSRKEERQRGRWGLGKTVFPATSRINSFFGYTRRVDDEKTYLMGQSVLKIHRQGDERYCPYGFFADVSKDEFQRPFDSPHLLAQFRTDFKLQRSAESGLSVVIPFPDVEEIKPDDMVRSAITHYFYPILCRELAVEVVDEERTRLIDADSIAEIADSVTWTGSSFSPEQLSRLFSLVRRTIAIPADQLLVLPEPKPVKAPDWSTPTRFDEATVTAIKEQFRNNQLLAIRVPLTVRPKGKPLQSTYFDVFVERDPTASTAEDHYIRQGITISSIATLREKGFRGLVIVDDPPLSTLLGDSENPAHTEWLEKATKLKERFEWGPFTVRFVRNALPRIVAKLLHEPEGRDEKLLKHIFFVEDELEPETDHQAAKPKRKKQADDGGEKPDVPPDLPPPRSAIDIQRIPGGFRVARREGASPEDRFSIEVAYEVRRGNPFTKYEKWDFDLKKKPITIVAQGAEVSGDANMLSISPTDASFQVEVTGFDPHRDLAVRTVKSKGERGDAEEI
jgi:hypothetical protein